MRKRTDLDFVVRWLPFQLNAQAPTSTSKVEMYMSKFGISKEDALKKGDWMGQKFKAVGLPFRFTEEDLTGNTFDAHRVMTAAYEKGGPAAQDKACESFFQAYFAEGKAPSDPAVLKAAADAAGIDSDSWQEAANTANTKEEFGVGRSFGVTGVPHFVVYEEGSAKKEQVGGAQPPEEFATVFSQVARA